VLSPSYHGATLRAKLTYSSNTFDQICSCRLSGGWCHSLPGAVDIVTFSMRNTGRGGWRDMAEHALCYRKNHARARQVKSSLPHLDLSYEAMADDVNYQLERLFVFLAWSL